MEEVNMKMVDKIKEALKSNQPNEVLAQRAQLTVNDIVDLRNGDFDINELSLGTAQKLADFYDAAVIDLIAQGDWKVANLKSDMYPLFCDILESQFETIHYAVKATDGDVDSITDNIRGFHVLHHLFHQALNDNEMFAQLTPSFQNTEMPTRSNIEDI